MNDTSKSYEPIRKSDPNYWTRKEIVYTNHAIQRANERNLPVIKVMPNSVKIAHVETNVNTGRIDSVICKVDIDGKNFHLVLSSDGVVITTFIAGGTDYQKWMLSLSRRKNRTRNETTLFYE